MPGRVQELLWPLAGLPDWIVEDGELHKRYEDVQDNLHDLSSYSGLETYPEGALVASVDTGVVRD